MKDPRSPREKYIDSAVSDLLGRVCRLERAPYREKCEKVEEDIDLPPRASWGDSDPRVDGGVEFRKQFFYVDDLPETRFPAKWKLSLIEGGILASHPEHDEQFIFDPMAATTAVFTPLSNTDRDARLVDRSRR